MRHRLLLALLVMFALTTASCGGGGDDADNSADADADAGADTDAAADDESDPSGDMADDADAEPTTTTTAPLTPPTTRGPAPVLDVEPVTGVGAMVVISGEPAYTGLLGQLDPERNIAPAVALPPADAAPGVAPLTGLPLTDPSIAERPALIAKVDNTTKGRPQEALHQADIVFVTEIEAGFTRLMVVYHSQTPDVIGPIRSGRTTDISVFRSFNDPIFAFSGANAVQFAVMRRYEMVNLSAGTRSEYFRSDERPGTYDLMTEPAVLYDIAAALDEGGSPPVHFEYRDATTALPPTAVPAGDIRIDYRNAGVDYRWDADLEVWRRSQDGTPHVDAADMEVRPANVVIAEVSRLATGTRDGAGAAVNEQQFIGSGRGWVFTGGHAIEVTWTKPSLASVPTWTTADGVPVPLTPGQTWVELVPFDAVAFS